MSLHDKIVSPEDLPSCLAQLPRPLIFTNGVFDILHPGHVAYLEDAAALGRCLLVAINTDASVKLLSKGDDRPINCQQDRAVMLAALASVDGVTFFAEQTPLDVLQIVRPDIYVKGGDYDMDALAESQFVRSYGGQAIAIPFRNGFSTTALLQRIRAYAA